MRSKAGRKGEGGRSKELWRSQRPNPRPRNPSSPAPCRGPTRLTPFTGGASAGGSSAGGGEGGTVCIGPPVGGVSHLERGHGRGLLTRALQQAPDCGWAKSHSLPTASPSVIICPALLDGASTRPCDTGQGWVRWHVQPPPRPRPTPLKKNIPTTLVQSTGRSPHRM